MNQTESKTMKKFDKYSLVWLAMGAVLLFFYAGKWNLPLAAWFAPVFLMRFSRTQKPLIGFILITLTGSIASIINMQGLIPVQGAPYYIMMVVGSIFGALLYLFDRLIATRINNFLPTLVFPVASVALGYLHVSTSLYGANGCLALTQNNLALLQIVSILGMWGVIFLVNWFAPFISWMWERKFEYSQIRVGTSVFALIMLSVFLFGTIRLSFFAADSETIRIASISSRKPDPDIPSKDQSWESFRIKSAEKQESILDLSQQAVCSGAKIITWREGEIYILKEDEPEFINRGIQLAKDKSIFLGMSLATFTKNFPEELAENKIVWIDTTGNVMFEYLKAIPTPTEKCIAGDGKVKLLTFPKSKIASTICFDLDFPAFMRKFGKAGVDIMVSPANDWDAISKTHPHQVSFRAIENGFSLVRPNSNSGLGTAYDYQGRLLSSIDHARTKNEILISDVPSKGVTTIYSLIGDLFAWLCSIGFVFVAVWTFLQRKKA